MKFPVFGHRAAPGPGSSQPPDSSPRTLFFNSPGFLGFLIQGGGGGVFSAGSPLLTLLSTEQDKALIQSSLMYDAETIKWQLANQLPVGGGKYIGI